MINDQFARVYLLFKQLSAERDYEVLRRYVLSNTNVKRKFAFFLNLGIPFRYIKSVSMGRCELTFVSYNRLIVSHDSHVYAYQPALTMISPNVPTRPPLMVIQSFWFSTSRRYAAMLRLPLRSLL